MKPDQALGHSLVALPNPGHHLYLLYYIHFEIPESEAFIGISSLEPCLSHGIRQEPVGAPGCPAWNYESIAQVSRKS